MPILLVKNNNDWYGFITVFYSDFKVFRGLILHRSLLSYVDSIISKLLVEKIHL